LQDGFTPVATKGREGKNFVTEVYNFMKKRYASPLSVFVKVYYKGKYILYIF
jgi:hypothetical protein